MGVKTGADPNVFLVKDGKLYVFFDIESRAMVEGSHAADKSAPGMGRAEEVGLQPGLAQAVLHQLLVRGVDQALAE